MENMKTVELLPEKRTGKKPEMRRTQGEDGTLYSSIFLDGREIWRTDREHESLLAIKWNEFVDPSKRFSTF